MLTQRCDGLLVTVSSEQIADEHYSCTYMERVALSLNCLQLIPPAGELLYLHCILIVYQRFMLTHCSVLCTACICAEQKQNPINLCCHSQSCTSWGKSGMMRFFTTTYALYWLLQRHQCLCPIMGNILPALNVCCIIRCHHPKPVSSLSSHSLLASTSTNM